MGQSRFFDESNRPGNTRGSPALFLLELNAAAVLFLVDDSLHLVVINIELLTQGNALLSETLLGV